MRHINIKGCTLEEAQPYIDYIEKKYNRRVAELELRFDGDYVDIVGGKFEREPFERVRRITGYLVPSPDHWVDSKKAELKHRVKHTTEVEQL